MLHSRIIKESNVCFCFICLWIWSVFRLMHIISNDNDVIVFPSQLLYSSRCTHSKRNLPIDRRCTKQWIGFQFHWEFGWPTHLVEQNKKSRPLTATDNKLFDSPPWHHRARECTSFFGVLFNEYHSNFGQRSQNELCWKLIPEYSKRFWIKHKYFVLGHFGNKVKFFRFRCVAIEHRCCFHVANHVVSRQQII